MKKMKPEAEQAVFICRIRRKHWWCQRPWGPWEGTGQDNATSGQVLMKNPHSKSLTTWHWRFTESVVLLTKLGVNSMAISFVAFVDLIITDNADYCCSHGHVCMLQDLLPPEVHQHNNIGIVNFYWYGTCTCILRYCQQEIQIKTEDWRFIISLVYWQWSV